MNVGPTGKSPVGVMIVHDTEMITQKTVETMNQWKGNSIESSKKFATLKQKMDRYNCSEVSQHGLKGVEIRRKR